MLPHLQYSAIRYESFAQEILAPLAFPLRAPLTLSWWRPKGLGRPDIAIARKGKFTPCAIGTRWGPVWSTAWFRVQGVVPASMRGQCVALRFSSGTEGTLWNDGAPVHGFDPYRDFAVLLPRAKGGEKIDCFIEAACNLPLGISTFWWDHPEQHARWKEEQPGRVELCELVAYDHDAWRFAQDFDSARSMMLALDASDPRAKELDTGLRALHARIPAAAPRRAIKEARTTLDRLLAGSRRDADSLCNAVGHAHIDTAWLWPIVETRRKCIRSFANVLALMDRFPNFRFLCSQAQQYAYVEEDAPALFAQIKRAVKAGRWEAAGAMWIEPDCTCPSGESFIRQMLHGCGYWQRAFGKDAPQRQVYLPDTFGFPASFPQILRHAGMDTFITNKMSWCETNRFPHVTFMWRGIDGSEILTHLTPGHNYNSSILPQDFVAGENNLVTSDAVSSRWLQPYGFGDGGGGPTAEMAQRAELGARWDGLPRVEQKSVHAWCSDLHRDVASKEKSETPAQRWDGELYLELHRGTYTSQAWIKQANLQNEEALRRAELLSAAVATRGDCSAARALLDGAWKSLLLNQFHDILPGSSITAVYEDAQTDHQAILDAATEVAEIAAAKVLSVLGGKDSVVVLNPASSRASGVAAGADGELHFFPEIPACSVAAVVPWVSGTPDPVEVSKHVLANRYLAMELDSAGRIAALVRNEDGRVLNASAAKGRALLPLNQLMLFEDRPRRWEAWDTDRDYREKASPVESPARLRVVTDSGIRGEIEVVQQIGARSEMRMIYRLDALSRRVEVLCEVDWQESQTLLRAEFPIDVRARQATYGIQFGAIERATHRNTSMEKAQFEVPGHRWMDIAEPGLGVSILDEGKYGRDARASARSTTLGLSLLKSPNFPDATCDRRLHAFRYAILAHEGDWRAAEIDAEAERFLRPLTVLGVGRGKGTLAQPCEVSAEAPMSVEIAAIKPCESGAGIAIRLVEKHGARGLVCVRLPSWCQDAFRGDAFENPLAASEGRARFNAKRNEILFELHPFGVATIVARP
ncbi:MAG: alpha-mannosidase [Phycisphaerales bacterium]|nr:alpha-mannosidase [Phycisphaerales bacterium]